MSKKQSTLVTRPAIDPSDLHIDLITSDLDVRFVRPDRVNILVERARKAGCRIFLKPILVEKDCDLIIRKGKREVTQWLDEEDALDQEEKEQALAKGRDENC